MTAPDRHAGAGASLVPALLLGLGGLAWVPARHGVMTTWEGTWIGVDYVGWNRLMLIPLLLLAAGALAAARAATRRGVTVAWAVVGAGFLLAAAGVVIEFVVGGGLRGGPESLAVAGWMVYVLGVLVTGVSALVLAAALARERRRWAAGAAAVAGIATLAWPAAVLAPRAELVDQVLVGLAWAALGVLVRRRPELPARGPGRAEGGRLASGEIV